MILKSSARNHFDFRPCQIPLNDNSKVALAVVVQSRLRDVFSHYQASLNSGRRMERFSIETLSFGQNLRSACSMRGRYSYRPARAYTRRIKSCRTATECSLSSRCPLFTNKAYAHNFTFDESHTEARENVAHVAYQMETMRFRASEANTLPDLVSRCHASPLERWLERGRQHICRLAF